MIVAPCKDCTKRHISCHSTCEDYKNWSDDCKKLKEGIEADRRANIEVMEHLKDVRERARKRHGY